MRTFLLFVHVVAAVVLVGPTTYATSAFAKHAIARDLDTARFTHRTSRIYAVASLIVAVVGIILAARISAFDELWIQLALTLFIVGLALLAFVHLPAQRASIEALEVGREVPSATVMRLRISAGLYGLSWVVIVWLMIAKPS